MKTVIKIAFLLFISSGTNYAIASDSTFIQFISRTININDSAESKFIVKGKLYRFTYDPVKKKLHCRISNHNKIFEEGNLIITYDSVNNRSIALRDGYWNNSKTNKRNYFIEDKIFTFPIDVPVENKPDFKD